MDRTALFDLDGTLADFEQEFMGRMSKLGAPSEPVSGSDDFWQDDLPEHLRERKRLVKVEPGFWARLPRIELGFQIFDIVVNECGFRPVILTKGPWKNPRAWMEKHEWCAAQPELEDVPVIIAGGDDDAKSMVYGRILVDDYPPYVTEWLKVRPRGLVIMPERSINEGFSHPNVVKCDGSNLDEVRKRVRQARDRDPGRKPQVSVRREGRKRDHEDWQKPFVIRVDGKIRARVWWVNGHPYLRCERYG